MPKNPSHKLESLRKLEDMKTSLENNPEAQDYINSRIEQLLTYESDGDATLESLDDAVEDLDGDPTTLDSQLDELEQKQENVLRDAREKSSALISNTDEKEPVIMYTKDPHDPRLQSYQDSLQYNQSYYNNLEKLGVEQGDSIEVASAPQFDDEVIEKSPGVFVTEKTKRWSDPKYQPTHRVLFPDNGQRYENVTLDGKQLDTLDRQDTWVHYYEKPNVEVMYRPDKEIHTLEKQKVEPFSQELFPGMNMSKIPTPTIPEAKLQYQTGFNNQWNNLDLHKTGDLSMIRTLRETTINREDPGEDIPLENFIHMRAQKDPMQYRLENSDQWLEYDKNTVDLLEGVASIRKQPEDLSDNITESVENKKEIIWVDDLEDYRLQEYKLQRERYQTKLSLYEDFPMLDPHEIGPGPEGQELVSRDILDISHLEQSPFGYRVHMHNDEFSRGVFEDLLTLDDEKRETYVVNHEKFMKHFDEYQPSKYVFLGNKDACYVIQSRYQNQDFTASYILLAQYEHPGPAPMEVRLKDESYYGLEKGTYFTRERQPQESGGTLYLHGEKTPIPVLEYFDKKGKQLPYYKVGEILYEGTFAVESFLEK